MQGSNLLQELVDDKLTDMYLLLLNIMRPCVQDAYLPHRLIDKRLYVYKYIEMTCFAFAASQSCAAIYAGCVPASEVDRQAVVRVQLH